LIVDTSALLAILFDEPEGPAFLTLLIGAPKPMISTANLLEAWIVTDRHFNSAKARALDALLPVLGIEQLPVSSTQIVLARQAYEKYGKGRHPASLNFGDCFAYSLAKLTKNRLLFKGNDFSKTDIEAAG